MNNDFDTRLERAVVQYQRLRHHGPTPVWSPRTRVVLRYAVAAAAAVVVAAVGWYRSASSPAWPDGLRAQVRASPFAAAAELGRELDRARHQQQPVRFRIPPPPARGTAFQTRRADDPDQLG